MKSPVWLIIKKDLLRFRALLALWFAALILRVCLPAILEDSLYNSNRGELMFGFLLIVLLNAQLVNSVLAEDSPIKEAAFWRTRPISGRQMIRAKLGFIGFWTLLLPMVVVGVAGLAYGFTLGECVAVASSQLIIHLLISGCLLLLSLFTHRMWSTLLGFWVVMIVAQLLGTSLGLSAGLMGSVGSLGIPSRTLIFETPSLIISRGIVAGIIILIGCAFSVRWVYQNRRRTLAVFALAMAFIGAKTTLTIWKSDYLHWLPALQRLEAKPDSLVTAKLTGIPVQPSYSTINDVRYQTATAKVDWIGLSPDQVCIIYRTEGDVVWADGQTIRQNQNLPGGNSYDMTKALQSIGLSIKGHHAEPDVDLAKLPEADFAKLKRTSATWKGRISVAVGIMEPTFRIPLKRSANFEQGARQVSISEVSIDRDQLKVTVSERKPDLPARKIDGIDTRKMIDGFIYSYALVNQRHMEALLVQGGGSGHGTTDGFFSFQNRELQFRSSGLVGPGQSMDTKAWENWVKDAELVKFAFIEQRRIAVDADVPLTDAELQ